MIEFQSVAKQYKGTKHFAIQDVSFRIEDGEFVFLVGPSGSGKSTIIKLVSAEERLSSGSILSNGFDLSKLRRRRIPFYRRTLGVVFQDFRLIQSKTVEENLTFVMRVIGIDPWFINDRVEEVLELVELRGLNKRYPRELSGGEQQRVAIARALMNRPSVILADEPTGNLDPDLSFEIMKIFERVNQELNTTVLVVTHEKSLVDQMDKRVIYLNEGHIIGDRLQGDYRMKKEQV